MDIGAFSTRFLISFLESALLLLLGSFVSGLIAVFARPEDISRLIPKNNLSAVCIGSMLGFLFPVGEYGVVPVTRRLYQKGMPPAMGIAFLLAAPVINPIVLASTYHAWGFGPVLIGRFVIIFGIATLVSLVFSSRVSLIQLLKPDSAAEQTLIPHGIWAGLRQAIRLGSQDFVMFGRYLLMGTTLSAALQILIPADKLVGMATHPIYSVLVMAVWGFVLSLSSTSDASTALVFVRPLTGGFTVGSLLTFLTFSAIADLKSTALLLGLFRYRVILYMIILPLLMSVLIGVWLNLNVQF